MTVIRRLTPLILCYLLSFFSALTLVYADDVTINTFYPSPYAEHTTAASSENVRIQNPFTGNTTTSIYGNVIVNNNVIITNSLFKVAPGKGPYGDDGLSIDPTSGKVAIGNHFFVNSLLTAQTQIKTQNAYAFSLDTSSSNYVYAYAEAEDNTALDSVTYPDNGKRALFGARQHSGGTKAVDIANDAYIPMRVEAEQVHLGVIDINKGAYTQNALGIVGWIGIGKDRDYTNPAEWPPTPASMLLEVNGNAWISSEAGYYSSREFKKDIVPLSMEDNADVLLKLKAMDVVHYRLKNDPQRSLKIGIIAEDSPQEIISEDGKHLSTTDALGFLAASIKELKKRNDLLRTRIEKLEERKKFLLTHA